MKLNWDSIMLIVVNSESDLIMLVILMNKNFE
jgi:hypothetical protein